jgi:hypothetical protein
LVALAALVEGVAELAAAQAVLYNAISPGVAVEVATSAVKAALIILLLREERAKAGGVLLPPQ